MKFFMHVSMHGFIYIYVSIHNAWSISIGWLQGLSTGRIQWWRWVRQNTRGATQRIPFSSPTQGTQSSALNARATFISSAEQRGIAIKGSVWSWRSSDRIRTLQLHLLLLLLQLLLVFLESQLLRLAVYCSPLQPFTSCFFCVFTWSLSLRFWLLSNSEF